MQHLAFPRVELRGVPVGPFLQLAEVPLDGSTTRWCGSSSSWFSVIWELAEEAFPSTMQVTNDELRQDRSPCCTWGAALVPGLQLGFNQSLIHLAVYSSSLLFKRSSVRI